MNPEINKQYGELESKYSLPKLSELDSEFHISELDETSFVLSSVRIHIVEHFTNYIDFLADVLNPDTNITGMYEARIFNESEKKSAYETFRRLMFWKRSSLQISLDNTDKANSEFIIGFYAEWPDLKQSIKLVVAKISQAWKNDLETTESIGYFG